MFIKNLYLTAVFTIILYSASAQSDWRIYGVDDIVSIEVQQQPKLTDSLGMTFMVSDTDHGRLVVLKMKDDSGPRTDAELEKFYEDALNTFTKSSGITLARKEYQMIGTLKCLRFKTDPLADGSVRESILVRLDRRAYMFQYGYAQQSLATDAERDHYFSSIKFLPVPQVENQLANSQTSLLAGSIVLLTIAVFPIGGIIFLVYLGVKFIIKRTAQRGQSV
jgi:hypothetical protein